MRPGALSIRTKMPSFTVVLNPTASRSVLVLGLSFAGQVYRMSPPLFPKMYVAPAATQSQCKRKVLVCPAAVSVRITADYNTSKYMIPFVKIMKSKAYK